MLSISCILKPNSKYLRTFSEAGKNGKANSDRGARYRNPDTEEAIWNKGMYFDSYIRLELKMPDSHNYSADIGRQEPLLVPWPLPLSLVRCMISVSQILPVQQRVTGLACLDSKPRLSYPRPHPNPVQILKEH
ncbi:hypothetical protein Peur_060496 [Populus x canadensis]